MCVCVHERVCVCVFLPARLYVSVSLALCFSDTVYARKGEERERMVELSWAGIEIAMG